MNTDNFYIAGVVVLVLIAVYMLRHKRSVNQMLADNNNVVPLMQQRATQLKVTRLQEATKNNAPANQQLLNLVAAYKGNQLGVKEYNDRLDKMINELDVEL